MTGPHGSHAPQLLLVFATLSTFWALVLWAAARYGLPLPLNQPVSDTFHCHIPSHANQRYITGRSRSASPSRRSASLTSAHIATAPPSLWNSPMQHSNLVIISTKFNPTLTHNLKIRYHRSNREQRFKFTENQRGKAKDTEQAVDLDDFMVKLLACPIHIKLFLLTGIRFRTS